MAGTIPAVSRDVVVTVTDAASHSATLACHLSDHSLAALQASGAELLVVECADHYTGFREGKRVPMTLSFSAVAQSALSAFDMLVTGKTSGYTSTAVSLGDAKMCSMTFAFPYGAETRAWTFAYVHFTMEPAKVGDPITKSYSATIYGAVTAQDVNGVAVTLIAAL